MADHQQLRILAELGDQAEETVQVHVVERRFDLIHHVERRGSTAEHGEQIRERGEAALATRQQRQLLDVLAAGLGLDLDSGVQHVVGLREHQRAGTAREQVVEQVREMLAHVGEGRCEHALDLDVDRLDHPEQLATRLADVVELRIEECVTLLQFVELLERERIDRTEQAQLAVEVAHLRRRVHAFGQRRHLGGLRHLGLDVVIATQRLDGGLQTQLHLGIVDLDTTRPLAGLVELAFGRRPTTAHGVELRGDGAHLVALLAPDFEQRFVA